MRDGSDPAKLPSLTQLYSSGYKRLILIGKGSPLSILYYTYIQYPHGADGSLNSGGF
jgi:hypothetical protein